MLAVTIILFAIFLLGALYAYRVAFFSPKKGRGELSPIVGEGYDPHRPEMRRLYRQLQARPCEMVTVTSRDGLTLSGRYYHVADGAPLDIGFHGYRSTPIRDFSGGSELSLQLGHNLLLVDQRAHGKSGGYTITFGIREREDLLCWVDYAISRFGSDVKIMLYGISMGAATVLMSTELDLPDNVKGVIADCPYDVPLDIILHVGKTMPIPQWLIRPFVILGARIFGRFNIRQTSASSAVKKSSVPILILHGEADSFVPCHMSAAIEEANPKLVRRYTFADADHGISFLVHPKKYAKIASDFMAEVL